MKTNNFLLGVLLCALVVCLVACDSNEPDITADNVCSHAFEVSPSGKQIYFSKGNLQYQASTGMWRFAEKQYNIIGDENSNISPSYSGWIDLFGWGTGNNPTLTSIYNSAYDGFTDWGVNSISNATGDWRTLTNDEWEYILTTHRHTKATVCGVTGLLLLPSDFKLPAGLSLKTNANNYKRNIYKSKRWLQIQQAGAVFLPTSGIRWRASASYNSIQGIYWSSTPDGKHKAWQLYFDSDETYMRSVSRSDGFAVRLVQDVK